VNQSRAIAFIHAKGSEIEKARIAHILKGVKPPPHLVSFLADKQNEDGGFPFQGHKGCPSTISDTTFSLVWLDDLGLLKTDAAGKAIAFIHSRQNDDGSWDENPAIKPYNPPPWMRPGERAVVVYTTAYSLFWLLMAGKTVRVSHGLEFLTNCQLPTGAFEGFRHSSWLAVPVIGMMKGWETAVVKQGLDFLSGIADEQWIPSQISWMLWTFLKCGAPTGIPLIGRMIELLLSRQAEDGSFPAEDGPRYAVNATIEALKVLNLYQST
jgi:prenyltransferase beta subunit